MKSKFILKILLNFIVNLILIFKENAEGYNGKKDNNKTSDQKKKM